MIFNKFELFTRRYILSFITIFFTVVLSTYGQVAEIRELKEVAKRTEIFHFIKEDKNGNSKVDKNGQTITKAREISVGDTIVVKIKKNRNGVIKHLEQHYINPKNSNLMQIEHYKKDRFWILSNLKSVPTKKKNISEYIYEGEYKHYDSSGRLIILEHYKNNELQPMSITYHYYDDNSLKLMLERQENRIWNILEYNYPNGKSYDYGDFKDGEGSFIPMDGDKIRIN